MQTMTSFRILAINRLTEVVKQAGGAMERNQNYKRGQTSGCFEMSLILPEPGDYFSEEFLSKRRKQ